MIRQSSFNLWPWFLQPIRCTFRRLYAVTHDRLLIHCLAQYTATSFHFWPKYLLFVLCHMPFHAIVYLYMLSHPPQPLLSCLPFFHLGGTYLSFNPQFNSIHFRKAFLKPYVIKHLFSVFLKIPPLLLSWPLHSSVLIYLPHRL